MAKLKHEVGHCDLIVSHESTHVIFIELEKGDEEKVSRHSFILHFGEVAHDQLAVDKAVPWGQHSDGKSWVLHRPLTLGE